MDAIQMLLPNTPGKSFAVRISPYLASVNPLLPLSLIHILLASIERMALGANLHVDIFLGRTSYELVSAVAGNLCLIVSRMDSFSHDFHLFTFSII